MKLLPSALSVLLVASAIGIAVVTVDNAHDASPDRDIYVVEATGLNSDSAARHTDIAELGDWQQAAVERIEKFEENNLDAIAYFAFDERDIHYGFKGAAPAGLEQLAADLHTTIYVEENLGYSEAEMVELGQAIHYETIAAIGDDRISTDIDVQRGVISLAVHDDCALSAQDLAATMHSHPQIMKLMERAPEKITLRFLTEPVAAGLDG